MFLQNFAQAAGECTVNGQTVDCGDAAKAAGGILAGFGIFMLVLFALGIFSTIIWILCLVHLIQHEDVENRILWIVLVLLVPLANFVYYFGFRRSYDKKKSVNPQGPPQAATSPAGSPGVVSPQQDSSTAAGVVAGGAAVSSGLSSQPTISVADNSGPQDGSQPGTDVATDTTGADTGLGDDISPDNTEIAQADSAPAFSNDENSSSDSLPHETSESITPDTDSSSGSTGEMPSIGDDTSVPPAESGSESSGDGLSATPDNNSSDQNPTDSSGPSFG